MLDVQQLSCIRDERVLFHQLSFTLSAGQLLQIEGANGAGKTTLLRIIAGLGFAESGQIYWRDENIIKNREGFHNELLFLGHHAGVKRELTAFENLAFYQKMHHTVDQDKLWHALAKVGLSGKEDLPVAQLSAGQTRRVALARLWLSDAPLWILDEPLTAIDKQGIQVLEKLFKQHVAEGGMVLFTTHQDMFVDDTELRRIKLGD